MKKYTLILILLICITKILPFTGFGMYYLKSQNEPYAPVFKIHDNMDNPEMYLPQKERVKSMIPLKAEVNVPPYPDAVVFLVHTTDELKQATGTDGLAEIKLITTHSKKEIVQFYKEKLPGIYYHESFSVLYHGEDEVSISELMGGMPHISLMEASPSIKELVPDATYLIGVVYETKK